MKYLTTKLSLAALLAVVAAGAATVGALADAGFRIAGGIYGVPAGTHLQASLICLDKEKEIANGVTIKTTMVPLGHNGHVGTGVSVSCP